MVWWMGYVVLRICLQDIHPFKIPQIKESLFNNQGHLVAARAAGPPGNWADPLIRSSFSGLGFCAHTWYGSPELPTACGFEVLTRTSDPALYDCTCPVILTGVFPAFSLYSWEQNLTVFSLNFWPNQLWPGNGRGSRASINTRFFGPSVRNWYRASSRPYELGKHPNLSVWGEPVDTSCFSWIDR